MTNGLITHYIQNANDMIKKGQRHIELCSLLMQHKVDDNDYSKVSICFSWLEHSNKTPKEIFNEVFT